MTTPTSPAGGGDLEQAAAGVSSGADWQALLALAARDIATGGDTVLRVYAWRPDATLLASRQQWQESGRPVRDGEAGVRIPVGTGEAVTELFDVAQTVGSPPPPAPPPLPTGLAPPGLYAALVAQAEAAGYHVAREEPPFGQAGAVDGPARRILVRPGITPAAEVAVLAHELGHVVLGHDLAATEHGCHGTAAVEAESVAYLATVPHGIDPARFTFPDPAAWRAGDPPAAVRRTLRRVVRAGQVIGQRVTAHLAPHRDNVIQALRGRAQTAARRIAAVKTRVITGIDPDGRHPWRVAEYQPAPETRRLLAAHEAAAAFYARHLRTDPAAAAHLADTGLAWTLQPGSPWTLGYAPDDGDALYRHLRAAGYSVQELHDTGLVTVAPDGQPRDRFVGRLMFPIRDPLLAGRPTVGFTGRALHPTPGQPDYLTSPRTVVHDPDRAVFGLAEQVLGAGRDRWEPPYDWAPVVCADPVTALAVARAGPPHVGLALTTPPSANHAALIGYAPGRGDRIILASELDPDRARGAFEQLSAVTDRQPRPCRIHLHPAPDQLAALAPEALAAALTRHDLPRLDTVVLDHETTATLRQATGDPFVEPRIVAARTAAEFIAGRPAGDTHRLARHTADLLGLGPAVIPRLIGEHQRRQNTAANRVRNHGRHTPTTTVGHRPSPTGPDPGRHRPPASRPTPTAER